MVLLWVIPTIIAAVGLIWLIIDRNQYARKAKDQNKELKKVLSKLIVLKDHKDCYGKTEMYLREQPLLWKDARDTLRACSGEHIEDQSNPSLYIKDCETCKHRYVNRHEMPCFDCDKHGYNKYNRYEK